MTKKDVKTESIKNILSESDFENELNALLEDLESTNTDSEVAITGDNSDVIAPNENDLVTPEGETGESDSVASNDVIVDATPAEDVLPANPDPENGAISEDASVPPAPESTEDKPAEESTPSVDPEQVSPTADESQDVEGIVVEASEAKMLKKAAKADAAAQAAESKAKQVEAEAKLKKAKMAAKKINEDEESEADAEIVSAVDDADASVKTDNVEDEVVDGEPTTADDMDTFTESMNNIFKALQEDVAPEVEAEVKGDPVQEKSEVVEVEKPNVEYSDINKTADDATDVEGIVVENANLNNNDVVDSTAIGVDQNAPESNAEVQTDNVPVPEMPESTNPTETTPEAPDTNAELQKDVPQPVHEHPVVSEDASVPPAPESTEDKPAEESTPSVDPEQVSPTADESQDVEGIVVEETDKDKKTESEDNSEDDKSSDKKPETENSNDESNDDSDDKKKSDKTDDDENTTDDEDSDDKAKKDEKSETVNEDVAEPETPEVTNSDVYTDDGHTEGSDLVTPEPIDSTDAPEAEFIEEDTSVPYSSLSEAFLLQEDYFEKPSKVTVSSDRKKQRLTEQLSLMIAKQSHDPLYEELIRSAAATSRLQKRILENYQTLAEERACKLVEKKKAMCKNKKTVCENDTTNCKDKKGC